MSMSLCWCTQVGLPGDRRKGTTSRPHLLWYVLLPLSDSPGLCLWRTEERRTHIIPCLLSEECGYLTKFYSATITPPQVEKKTTLNDQNPNRREVYSQLQGQFLFFILSLCLCHAIPYSSFLTYIFSCS